MEKNIIPSSFNVSNKSNSLIFKSSFDVLSNIPLVTKYVGTATNGNSVSIFSGTVKIDNPYNEYEDGYVENAKVTALRNGVVCDYDITDENGVYFLYLENGVYDIRIEAQSYVNVLRNYEIKNGIFEYKEDFVNGRVFNRFYDITTFSGNGVKKMVSGNVFDEHNKPVEDVEIVVVKSINIPDEEPIRNLVAFVKTDENGYFSFFIDSSGPYDVVVRSLKHHAKVFKKHIFNQSRGFFNDIKSKTLMFQKGGDWIWISN